MRKPNTVRFLKTIENGRFGNAFEAFLFSCGSAALLKQNLRNAERSEVLSADEERKAQQRFRVMMHRLKKDGLIEYQKQQKGIITAFLTEKAKKTLLGSWSGEAATALPKREYEKKKSQTVMLVLFDIPERYRKKRDWLRATLLMLGFELLQRSAWIGSVAIPERFLEDMRDMQINQFVEIVSIARSGTIKRINP